MSNLEELIEQLCPEGVEWKTIDEIAKVYTGGEPPINCIKGSIPHESCKYPIYGNGIEIYGYSDSYKINKDAVTISSIGANTGAIYYRKAYFTPIIRLKVLMPKSENILSKYIFYYLSSITISSKKSSVPNMNAGDVKKIPIPLPPLPIQKEIVNILDKFSQLQAELEAELQARRAQYEYYRNELLNFEGKEVEWKTLGEVCDNIISGKNTLKAIEGDYPVYGSTGIIGRSNHYIYDIDCLLIARVGANAGFVYKAKGKYDVSDNTLIIRPKATYNMSFAYFQLLNMGLNKFAVGGGQPLITAGLLKKLKIPIPPLNEQNRIAAILDKFDKLVNDKTEGLPAEIESRRKQYEYYRGKLLDFKELMVND